VTGVSPDTIRHYENIGVLPRALRTDSGYRLYTESTVERVLVVQRALRIGFTFAELAEVLKARDAGDVPCQRVYKLAKEKLKGVTADIVELKRTERISKQVLSEGRMQRTAPGQKSNLLHSVTGAVNGSNRKATQLGRRKTCDSSSDCFYSAGYNWQHRTCSPASCTKSTLRRPSNQGDVEKHGDEAMGFPPASTTHHFRLLPDGGAIEVTVNDVKDSQNVQAIRSHLTHIVTMFPNGDLFDSDVRA
jgi:DNA-binding transcriptional MerR regulator